VVFAREASSRPSAATEQQPSRQAADLGWRSIWSRPTHRRDRQGQFVADLKKDDFEIYEDVSSRTSSR